VHAVTGGVLQLGDVTYDVTPRVDPAPAPGPVPVGPRSVRIGATWFAVDAVDPTATSNPLGASYAGYRGPGQTIVYTAGASTVTNFWGVEVRVSAGGLVLSVNDRIASRSSKGTPIPADGCVISGHVPVAAALKAAAVEGALVMWSTDPAPAAPPAPTPVTPGGFVLAEYLMDGQGGVPALSPTCTQCRVAFVRLDSGRLLPVEWGGETPEQTQSRLASWVAGPPARRVLLSFGGQDGGTTFGDVAAFARGYAALAPKYSATGLDVDLEGGALDIASCVAACRACAAVQPGFLASFVPPGGPPVARYLEAARQVQAAGIPVQFGQQLYDAVVTKTQAIEQTRLAAAVLGPESVLVGVMIGSDAKHWDVNEADVMVGAVLEEFPRLGGVYFWQANIPGTDEASARIAARAAKVRAAA
jgi:hypothetical protein